MRYFIHSLITVFLVLLITGCNSSTIPTDPPDASHGGNQQNNNQLPSPPTPPTEPVQGDFDPLQVDISCNTFSAKVPMVIEFDSTVTGGLAPYKYFWDFDSNGVTDSVETGSKPIFSSPGIYITKLTVVDANGTQAVETQEIEAKFPTPNARPDALPMTGDAPLDINFIAEESTSQAGAVIVEYRWDFQPDGIWDYIDTTTGNTTYTYDDPGNYYPVLRVKDNLGFWEEASLHIIVTF